MVHDLLLSKGGIALPASHGLRASIERHKARLNSEFTKARIRRKCATVEALRAQAESALGPAHPRWIRVNTVKSTLDEQLDSTFKGFKLVPTVKELMDFPAGSKVICLDGHVPNLVAASPGADFTKTQAYKKGEIILQDKASCFPAYLLDPRPDGAADGDIIDACSAPGNKTTHLAGILAERGAELSGKRQRRIHAFEKDKVRAKTLAKMIRVAGSEGITTVHPGADFLRADPGSPEFEKVTCLLLDPSCSGSGIVGRDDAPEFCLPSASAGAKPGPAPRKRKREEKEDAEEKTAVLPLLDDDGAPSSEGLSPQALESRIQALASFQLSIILHAFSFPAARRVTYSTCSIYPGENEGVVMKALESNVAKRRGWKVLKREEQVRGMREWDVRGWKDECGGSEEIAEGCIRAERGDGRGTMGFFVVGFVRDGEKDDKAEEDLGPYERDEEGRIVRGFDGMPVLKRRKGEAAVEEDDDDDEDGEEWGGFDD